MAAPTAERVLPWVLRASWAALPFVAGPALAAALDDVEPGVRTAASVVLWAGWVIGLTASLVPHPVAMTALRVLAPAAALGASWAALNQPAVSSTGRIAALALWVPLLAVVFSAELGGWFVNGPAYPNERRFALRPPGPLLFGPVPLAWALTVGVPAAGVLLVASGDRVAGGIVLAVGAVLAFVLLRALHGLAHRWVVFVPAGLVLHDPLALVDPVLFRRKEIEVLRPAPADTDSLDLTKGALGLALELVLLEKVPMALTKPGTAIGEQGASGRLLFTPSRPGRVLAEARARRLPVG